MVRHYGIGQLLPDLCLGHILACVMIKLFAVQILAVQILLLVVLFIQDETVPGIVASVILVIAMLLILWSIVRSKEL